MATQYTNQELMDRTEKLIAESMGDYLPRSLDEKRPGKLIVLEGPDGSGRSSQMALLSEWLEWQGFAVQTMGLKRSKLLASDLEELQHNTDLQLMTRILLYATDFYDQIENVVLPSLRAGFIVLADRYTLTPICRAAVRGIDHDFLENVYKYAPEPDLKLRLSVSHGEAFHRLFNQNNAMNHWEFGGDLNISNNVYESFVEYQGQLHQLLGDMGGDKGYTEVDGNRRVSAVNADLRQAIAETLGIETTQYKPSDKRRKIFEQ